MLYMYEVSIPSIVRLKEFQKLCNYIFEICEEAGEGNEGIYNVMQDEKRDRPAICKHIENCQEYLKKVFEADPYLKEYFEPKDIRGFVSFRNILTHNYDEIDIEIVKDVINIELPNLLEIINKIVGEEFIPEKNILPPINKA